MTHEKIPNGEPTGGPEHDQTLPDAGEIPTFANVEQSDLPALDSDLED